MKIKPKTHVVRFKFIAWLKEPIAGFQDEDEIVISKDFQGFPYLPTVGTLVQDIRPLRFLTAHDQDFEVVEDPAIREEDDFFIWEIWIGIPGVKEDDLEISADWLRKAVALGWTCEYV